MSEPVPVPTEVKGISTPEEEKVHSVSLPVTKFILVSIVTFCVPLLFVLVEIGVYWWLWEHVPSPSFILWDWLGSATGSGTGTGPGMWIFLLPLAIVGFLFSYIIWCVLITTAWIHRWNRKSPPEEGWFSRQFSKTGVMDKRLHYYHMRGFAIKWPMWISSKSPFPWLVNWCLERNDNKFGKDVIFDDAFVPLELVDVGDNVYFGSTAATSAHTVNAIFGDLYIGRITVGSNVTVGAGSIIGPGSVSLPNSVFLPNTIVNSRWKDKWETLYYSGTSARPIPNYSGMHAGKSPASSEENSQEPPQKEE